ncbi:CD1247 N-terminal domain-containing protein [Carboxydothermus pertinax]|uniref:AraC family transcriptional regulator n=1 Tax=Carboxydothermus pertinax TaxID=870242 RepID=A0A1L8CU00_9THEO|nr:CD1247 N-terminal domain-containing protein [Carboxydothermus pertinax]GAV22381.1 hypothetical protein cpu_08910 [Carboxydothermus pertinax]
MDDIIGRVSYLQGLAEGINLKEKGKEGEIIAELIDLLADLTEEVRILRTDQERLEEYVETVDDDLYELEDAVYDDEDDEFTYVTCPECGEKVYFEREVLEADDNYEITCPNCGALVLVSEFIENHESKEQPHYDDVI